MERSTSRNSREIPIDHIDALTVLADHPHAWRLRELCESEDIGQRDGYRSLVIRLATGMPEPARAESPSTIEQAANLAGAVGRVVAAAARGEPIRVKPSAYDERLAICRECEFNAARPAGVKCLKCGCGSIKLQLATEDCPIRKW